MMEGEDLLVTGIETLESNLNKKGGLLGESRDICWNPGPESASGADQALAPGTMKNQCKQTSWLSIRAPALSSSSPCTCSTCTWTSPPSC